MLADAATVGLLFFLGFIALGVAVLSVLRYWLVEGTLDTAPALAVLGVILVGSASVVKTTSPFLMLLWIVALIGGALLIPVVAEGSDKHALHRMFEDDIAKYRRAIDRDSHNAAAWREIAELYLKMDRYDEAIVAYKEAIRLNPHDVANLRRRLNQTIDYQTGMPSTRTVVCDGCQQETASGRTCAHCGAALEMNFFQWLLQAQNLREVAKPTAAIMAGVVAVFTVFSTLPVAVKAAVIAPCVLFGGYIIWRNVQESD